MEGTRKFRLSSRDILFDIEIERNVTLIRGNGATYKTLLCKMLHAAAIKGSGVHLSSYNTRVLYLDGHNFAADHLRQYKGSDAILVFDETSTCIQTNAFREAIEETGCYFILITRNKCLNFGVSTKEVYELVSSDTLDLTRRTVYMQRLYPAETFGVYEDQHDLITEDSAAGKQFFNAVYNASHVITAHGKGNIVNKILHNPNSIIVVDGAAFGFNLEDVIPILERTHCFLIAKESFEYIILKSGIVNHLLSLDIEHPLVNSEKYLTWEQFYTDLLTAITKGTRLAYNKLSLNPAYLAGSNIALILDAYGLKDSQVQASTFFSDM